MERVVLLRGLQVNWVSFFADFLLAWMVFGPALAPFLAASAVFLLPGIADIIYFMVIMYVPSLLWVWSYLHLLLWRFVCAVMEQYQVY